MVSISKKFWGDVSDPARHDPLNFRYLIHAINLSAKSAMGLISAQASQAAPWLKASTGDQSINLCYQPERVHERVSVSMSLIDQDHTGTWGKAGLILKVPAENIIDMGPHDLGSLNSYAEAAHAFSKALMSPEQLLQQSAPTSYNEVLALAQRGDAKIELAGFFIKITSKGEPIDPMLANTIKAQAQRLGLPLIEIQGLKNYKNYEIRRGDDLNSLLVIHDDKFYHLQGWEGTMWPFRVYEPEIDRNHFITPRELDGIFCVMRSHGFNNFEEEADIRAKHAIAYDAWMKPTIKFDDQGKVVVIKKRFNEGPEERETEYVVTGNGVARRSDVKQEIEYGQRLQAGNGSIPFSGCPAYTPLPRNDAQKLIEEACLELDDERKQRVVAWAEAILPDVDQKSQSEYGRRSEQGSFLRHLSGFMKPGVDFIVPPQIELGALFKQDGGGTKSVVPKIPLFRIGHASLLKLKK